MYSPWQEGYDDAAILGISKNPYTEDSYEYKQYELGNKTGWKER